MLCRAGSSHWGSFTSKDPKSEQLASEGAGGVGLPAAAQPPSSRSALEESGAAALHKRPAGRPASRSAAEQMSEQMSRPSEVEMMEAEHAALRKVALRRAAAATRISPSVQPSMHASAPVRISPNLAPNAPVEVQNWW